MRSLVLAATVVFALMTTWEDSWGQTYKWVDEKGTLNFSDNPASVPPKKQGKQPQQPEKEKKQTVNQPKQPAKEDTLAILKGMEFGNRKIPEDMLKYGPGGGGTYQRPRRDTSEAQGAASSGGVRRS